MLWRLYVRVRFVRLSTKWLLRFYGESRNQADADVAVHITASIKSYKIYLLVPCREGSEGSWEQGILSWTQRSSSSLSPASGSKFSIPHELLCELTHSFWCTLRHKYSNCNGWSSGRRKSDSLMNGLALLSFPRIRMNTLFVHSSRQRTPDH